MKTSYQSASSSVEAGNVAPDFPRYGKLFDAFASLLQHAELHGGTLLKKIASDFNVALLRYQNNRTCDQDQNYFINLQKQCQRMIQLQYISNEVREIFQHNLEYIEEHIRNIRVKPQEQTILTYDEDIFESCD